MFKFFKKAGNGNLQEEWFKKGAEYAQAINDMVRFAETHGWDKWKGEDPTDRRAPMAKQVLSLLRAANDTGDIKEFRKNFPPAHAPFVDMLNSEGQSIDQIYFIDGEKIVFLTGTAYQKRQAYVLNGTQLIVLDENIRAIGKSMQNNVFAIANGNVITTTHGWQGDIIEEFVLDSTADIGITSLIPFNNGKRLLLVSADGIYLILATEEKLLHPVNEDDEEDWDPNIDMENATLSSDNRYIIVGDQGSDHRVLDADGDMVGAIGPQSSYPHFCLFSKNDEQLLTNSCHFYNGVSIGVDTGKLTGIDIEAYAESDDYTVLNEEMRVYAGIATSKCYILGDAYGYVKAIDKNGDMLWRHHVGSTINGITISDDEQTLWVASCNGTIHKLKLGQGQDAHTIGNGNHAEEFRLILWKNEPKPLFW